MGMQNFEKEIRAKTVGFIAAALGLAVGLAWNDAIKSLIEVLFPLEHSGVIAKFGYALLLTVVVVVVLGALLKVVQPFLSAIASGVDTGHLMGLLCSHCFLQ